MHSYKNFTFLDGKCIESSKFKSFNLKDSLKILGCDEYVRNPINQLSKSKDNSIIVPKNGFGYKGKGREYVPEDLLGYGITQPLLGFTKGQELAPQKLNKLAFEFSRKAFRHIAKKWKGPKELIKYLEPMSLNFMATREQWKAIPSNKSITQPTLEYNIGIHRFLGHPISVIICELSLNKYFLGSGLKELYGDFHSISSFKIFDDENVIINNRHKKLSQDKDYRKKITNLVMTGNFDCSCEIDFLRIKNKILKGVLEL